MEEIWLVQRRLNATPFLSVSIFINILVAKSIAVAITVFEKATFFYSIEHNGQVTQSLDLVAFVE